MFGILLWSILMAREVGNIPVAVMYILKFLLQGRKLASGLLFAVLLNFKHIYMYLAVCSLALICSFNL